MKLSKTTKVTKRAWANERKAQSQVLAELRATWTGYIWDMAVISGNSIQGAKIGLILILPSSPKKRHPDT